MRALPILRSSLKESEQDAEIRDLHGRAVKPAKCVVFRVCWDPLGVPTVEPQELQLLSCTTGTGKILVDLRCEGLKCFFPPEGFCTLEKDSA